MPDAVPKCLLVDDSSSMLKLLSMYMEHLGFEAVTAADGDEGIAAFREHRPSLVVSDIHMPNRNGLLLLHDIRETDCITPVILITGYPLDYKETIGKQASQPDAIMEKPFTLDELKSTIQRLLPKVH